jgi:threonine aldolase
MGLDTVAVSAAIWDMALEEQLAKKLLDYRASLATWVRLGLHQQRPPGDQGLQKPLTS